MSRFLRCAGPAARGYRLAAAGGATAACTASAATAAGQFGPSSPGPHLSTTASRNGWNRPVVSCDTGFPKFNRDWDCRHPPEGSGIKCQGKTRVVLLIRHGQYETKGGPGKGRLTDVGRQQARMAGDHIVARMRADSSLKLAMYKLTSSALDRAIETADIIEKAIVEELEWVTVERAELPGDMRLRYVKDLDEEYMELEVYQMASPKTISNKANLLQPTVQLASGSRLRVPRSGVPVAVHGTFELSSWAECPDAVCVFQKLADVKRLDNRFDEWRCKGCQTECPFGDIHWSDKAESNGIGLCDVCYAKGPMHKKADKDDTFSRITCGLPASPFRAPHDKNLNEADVDTSSVVMKDDPLYEDLGVKNAQILKDNAQVNAAFYSHMHRTVDHRQLKRKSRTDVVSLVFTSAGGEKHERHVTPDEFKGMEMGSNGEFPWIWDAKVKDRVDGIFTLTSIAGNDVAGSSANELRAKFAEQAKIITKRRPEKQVEIIVAHQNVIRYFFLKAMQFDTTAWLNFGGSNCTMTQLRITRRGDVICDFFADHGSKLPISHYTFNKNPDV